MKKKEEEMKDFIYRQNIYRVDIYKSDRSSQKKISILKSSREIQVYYILYLTDWLMELLATY